MIDAAPDGRERRIAVAIHDVEPVTFERCALIRDWLYDHGIDRATLLVVAPELFQRRPDLAAWLLDRRDRGDAIAQHGSEQRRSGRSALAVRAGALAPGRLLRVDLHPADFDRRRHVLALQSVLRRAGRRTAVTYDDLR